MLIVISVETKTISEQLLLLFDLTALQKEVDIKLNLTAEETLTITKNFYEKIFISYPRTGSQYIPEYVWTQIPKLIGILEEL